MVDNPSPAWHAASHYLFLLTSTQPLISVRKVGSRSVQKPNKPARTPISWLNYRAGVSAIKLDHETMCPLVVSKGTYGNLLKLRSVTKSTVKLYKIQVLGVRITDPAVKKPL